MSSVSSVSRLSSLVGFVNRLSSLVGFVDRLSSLVGFARHEQNLGFLVFMIKYRKGIGSYIYIYIL